MVFLNICALTVSDIWVLETFRGLGDVTGGLRSSGVFQKSFKEFQEASENSRVSIEASEDFKVSRIVQEYYMRFQEL